MNGIPESPDNGVKVAALYGEDNREEPTSSQFEEFFGDSSEDLLRSVVVLAIKNSDKSYIRDTRFEDYLSQRNDGLRLCPGETLKFGNQKVSSDVNCSGVLIGEKTILTAHHCIKNKCHQTDILFDYTIKNTNFNKSSVFSCKKIIKVGENGLDYAIIELDRKPKGRSPVSIRHSGRPSSKTLAMIGSPMALPLKLAYGKIKRLSDEKISMNLDAFKGNSGSPVFSYENGAPLLEGILVSGERDFTFSSYSPPKSDNKKGISLISGPSNESSSPNLAPCFKLFVIENENDPNFSEKVLRTTVMEGSVPVSQPQKLSPNNTVQ